MCNIVVSEHIDVSVYPDLSETLSPVSSIVQVGLKTLKGSVYIHTTTQISKVIKLIPATYTDNNYYTNVSP